MVKIKNKDGFLRRFIWHEGGRLLLVGMLYLIYRIKVYGKENLPANGPVVVLSNHQSFLDPLICQNWRWRPFYYITRVTLFKGFWGLIIDGFYTIPINQDGADLKSMRAIIEILKRGRVVCLYPEGSRTYDGKIAEIRPGFGLLVRRSGATIVPMVMDGIFERWPRTQKFPKLGGRVGVMYGKPIPADMIKQVGEEAFVHEFNQTMRTMHNDLRQKMGKEPYNYGSFNEKEGVV